jgi:hypothetical protein
MISGLLLLNGTASIKPTGREFWPPPKSLTLQDIGLCQSLNRGAAELFAYRVVLNGIVLDRSIREIVFTVYMTYRAFAGQGRRDASVVANRREPQSAPDLWRSYQAWLIGCRRP